jgi:hypothetical protein
MSQSYNGGLLLRELPYTVGDGSVSMKVRYDDPMMTNGQYRAGIVVKYLDVNNYLSGEIRRLANGTTTLILSVTETVGGTNFSANPLTTVTVPTADFPEDTDRWLRFVMNGDVMTAEFWKTNPASAGSASTSAPWTLTTTNNRKAKFGAGTKGRIGLYITNLCPQTAWVDDFTVAVATFSDTGFKSYNDGNFPAQPTIKMSGPLTNLRVKNEANKQQIYVPTTIPAGEVWVLDTEQRRFYRESDMANRFQYLDPTSDWPELQPGENPITITASGLVATSQVEVLHRHTIM